MSQKNKNRGLLADNANNIINETKKARYGMIKSYTFLSF